MPPIWQIEISPLRVSHFGQRTIRDRPSTEKTAQTFVEFLTRAVQPVAVGSAAWSEDDKRQPQLLASLAHIPKHLHLALLKRSADWRDILWAILGALTTTLVPAFLLKLLRRTTSSASL